MKGIALENFESGLLLVDVVTMASGYVEEEEDASDMVLV